MLDQLRADYLSCYGHPYLQTPTIDALAARGTRYTRAYVASPVCGPSRMSMYTGKSMRGHGVHWNDHPLSIAHHTLGDYVRPHGVRNALIGKTHVIPDKAGLARAGIDPQSSIGTHLAKGGFEPYEHYDGLYPSPYHRGTSYQRYLSAQGYEGDNLWHEIANSGRDAQGRLLDGWLLQNNDKPAVVAEEHSETAWTTNRALDFLDEVSASGESFVCHLSYIKPHWPYMAPEPYFSEYQDIPLQEAVRTTAERAHSHPLLRAYMRQPAAESFAHESCRRAVIPSYCALIRQIDDHLQRVFQKLAATGLADSTMVILCADHGDYLGDHWMGEKDFYHDCAARIPLIIAPPAGASPAGDGVVSDQLVGGVDLLPTILDWLNLPSPAHLLEGQSLMAAAGREYVVSEYDHSMLLVRKRLEAIARAADTLPQSLAANRSYMWFDGRYKYIESPSLPPILFDVVDDPDECVDFAADPARQAVLRRCRDGLREWCFTDHARTTMSNEEILAYDELGDGFFIGYWGKEQIAGVQKELAH